MKKWFQRTKTWLRRMRYQEYRGLFWRDFRRQLRVHEIKPIFCGRVLLAALAEILFCWLTFQLLVIEHKVILGVLGIGIIIAVGFVINSYRRTLGAPFRAADTSATLTMRQRHGL